MDRTPLALPRSVLLALWLAEPGAGSGPVQRTLDAVQGDDEPHRVEVVGARVPGLGASEDAPLPGAGAGTATLADLVAAWASGPRVVAAVLPAPGDPAGAPAAVAGPAQESGEAVLVSTPDGDFAAVPRVEVFGSVYEQGHQVTWRVHAVPAWRTTLVGHVGTLAEADRELTVALTRATEALTTLDVARWRPDAAERIAALRDTPDARGVLPPGLDPRRVRVIGSALRLRAIVDIATADDGAAVNLWQADQRTTALRDVDRAARRALAVATHPAHDAPDPARG
ncbi:hypothetical protein [Cellulomonas triticagri]|uniref:Uncharacterized protein n=1 Tax=Cellulomonas triticagri TaxID=2483352 RepID=A0A3M2JPU7_9CELL|nr:hypothetical protein [Cellulomonas triticagri]RMI13653.1 hypothetical protein EBM89_03340 [Cellulomonas triticagri]